MVRTWSAGAFTNRTGDHPGLAEPAATGTTTEDLDIEAVVDYLGEGHELVLRVRPFTQVRNGPLFDHGKSSGVIGHDLHEHALVEHRVVKRGHIDTGDTGQRSVDLQPVALAAGLPPGHDRGDLAHHLFAIAQDHEIHEVGDRFRVIGAMPADADQQISGGPISGVDRASGQVDHVEHIGVSEFSGEVEGQDVEICRSPVGVD